MYLNSEVLSSAGEKEQNRVLFHLSELNIPDSSWTLVTYEELSFFFAGEKKAELSEELLECFLSNIELSEKRQVSHRTQVSIKSVPFLVGFFPREQKIRLASARLSHELFAIKSLEQLNPTKCAGVVDETAFREFREHAESIASLNPADFPSVIDEVTYRYQLPDYAKAPEMVKAAESSGALVEKLLYHLNSYRPSFFERISDFALGLTAQYGLLRIHLLKFLAILPSLDHDKRGLEVKRNLLEAFRRLVEDHKKAKLAGKKGEERPLRKPLPLLFSGAYYFAYLWPAGALAKVIRGSVRLMARRFIAGESIEKARDAFKNLQQTGRDVTVDQLGELVVSEKEADEYCEAVLKLIQGFYLHVPKGEKNGAGIQRAHVSIKVSALCSNFRPQAPEYTYEQIAPRLRKILLEAKERDIFINIDAEHYDYRDIVFYAYKRVLLETPELENYEATGIVVQAYLRDGAEHLEEVRLLAKKRGIRMPIRLVKGAYWDAETIDADAKGHVAPEFLNKEETDIYFRQLIIKMLQAGEELQLCLASHNFADHAFARQVQKDFFPDSAPIEHQCLHMTYEALSTAMAKMGWPVRNYVPIGSLLVGMAYLVRRIMENSSQVGVLTMMRSHKKLAKIEAPQEVHERKKEKGRLEIDQSALSLTDEFLNLTPVRLYLESERIWITKAYEDFSQAHMGKFYENAFPLNGEEVEIHSSSDPSLTVGKIRFAAKGDGKRAIDELESSYNSGKWSNLTWVERSLIMQKAALMMTTFRAPLAALISYEAGKAVSEALADVDEAVDFINFYARQEGKLQRNNPNTVSRGVASVIAPWNFPIAIPTGMTAAALTVGDSVAHKSAEQAPLISQKMTEIFHAAGVPKDVLIHVPGTGEVVGGELVHDERVAQIVFTGSKDVGTMIHREASKRVVHNKLHNLNFPCKVITEMGGKNAIIVTTNAELDETVAGILYSAYAHAGQKCSAASRLIVDEGIRERLVERLEAAVGDLEVGRAFDMQSAVNPVITKEDQERLKKQVKEASAEAKRFGGRVHVDRSEEDLPGYCVGPSLIELPKNRAYEKDSFLQQELFGPVLHMVTYKNLDEAIKIFNATNYGLTGGIFSQSQDDIDYATEYMECGNLYVNRSITAARVGIEPFGGFKLSGTGPKAGSRYYLPAFHVNPFEESASEEKIPENGKGSDYDFDLCKSSGLGPLMRRVRMMAALDEMIQHFEVLYQGLYSDNKDVLMNFRKWVYREFKDYQTRRHWNRRIPGQLSYNNLKLVQEKCVVVSFEKRPYFSSLMQALGAVLMGTGVTIVARNEQAYHWWSQLKNVLARAGFSRENVDVFYATDKRLKEVLRRPDISTVVIDGRLKHVKDVLAFSGEAKEVTRVRTHLCPQDAPDVRDFKRLCSQFSWVRAFAVNTMRHGAPFELQVTES